VTVVFDRSGKKVKRFEGFTSAKRFRRRFNRRFDFDSAACRRQLAFQGILDYAAALRRSREALRASWRP